MRVALSSTTLTLAQLVLPPAPSKERRDNGRASATTLTQVCPTRCDRASRNLDSRSTWTKHLPGVRQRQCRGLAGTYATAASPAHRAGPAATVPRRWSHPGSTSVPSRCAVPRSTLRRNAPHGHRASSRNPGGEHRTVWLGASAVKKGWCWIWRHDFLDYCS